ncbi:ankyrin repeat domain-containing protein [Flavobacterium sp. LB1P62]|uniref:ankyrin repeat domain-containing protein n=1 Tax=unclassified Flavobacterium TaxID=196869 RepID=UPI003AACEB51
MKKIIFTLLILISGLLNAQNTAIFEAARTNDLKTIENFVKEGKDINTLNPSGCSLLILSVYNNSYEVAAYLISQKANLDIQDSSGNSALMGACFKGYSGLAELLLVHKASPDLINYNNANALFFAATFAQVKCVEILLKYKINTHQKDIFGKTALDYAVNQENEATISLLK